MLIGFINIHLYVALPHLRPNLAKVDVGAGANLHRLVLTTKEVGRLPLVFVLLGRELKVRPFHVCLLVQDTFGLLCKQRRVLLSIMVVDATGALNTVTYRASVDQRIEA